MPKEYPYQKSFPVIDVLLLGPRKIEVKALIDSGANISLFSKHIAEVAGIKIEKGKKIVIFGIGGKITAFLHEIPIRVNNYQFDCKIAFSAEVPPYTNLLGRDNFFIPFLITFDEKNQRFFIEENK
jgi:hypothetical protein